MVFATIKQRWIEFIKESLFSAQFDKVCSSKYWMRMVTGVLEITTVPSILIPRSALHNGFLLLYSPLWMILAFHLLIIQAYTWVHVPSDTLWCSVSCSNQGSTVQESCPHKCDVSSFPLDIPEFLSFRTSWKVTLTI